MKKTVLLLLILALMLPLCSCKYIDNMTSSINQAVGEYAAVKSEESEAVPVAEQTADEFEALLQTLSGAGFGTDWEDADKLFFPVARRSVELAKDTYLNVLLYDSHEAAEADSHSFSEDGAAYDSDDTGVDVDWAAAPHFYLHGSMILFYVGEDEAVISTLTNLFGSQFAGL